ncbi:MAG: PHP domain-containing protein [Vulcanimicrobiaceae bacterium]
MLVDFHSHTSYSDGTLSPAELCAAMQRRGVGIFSISDHDTLCAYDELTARAGQKLVVGVEINTTYRHNEVHILGYGLPCDNVALNALLERNRTAREKRVRHMVEQLQGAGFEISFADVQAEARESKALGRPHVGKALIRRGHAADIPAAFRTFLRRGKPGYIPSTHIEPHEAIETIASAGGVPVLAHPGRLHDYGIIDELAGRGLRGLEVFYPTHERGQVQHFRDIASRLGLLMTGGSDFHDARYNSRGVGMEIEDADIRPFLNSVL